jgi:hypothetical protein
MPSTVVKLPPGVAPPFEVYLIGVRQEPGVDYDVTEQGLVFPRSLRRDRVSGWRWFIGAWGVGTYRQDDQVDVRYQAGGRTHVAQKLEMLVVPD